MNYIKSVVNRIKIFIKYVGIFFVACMKILRVHMQKRKCIVFIATPIYENLGDYAIVYAQYKFFEDIGYHKDIIEFTSVGYKRLKRFLPLIIGKQDVIIIDGGGNIGTLWIEEEEKMRDIINRFPKNPIFIFPQTAFFSDDEYGKLQLNESIKIYNQHTKLTVFCRDIQSFQLFQNKFKNVRSMYTPDIVLYIEDAKYDFERKGVLLCLRNDKEKVLSESVQGIIEGEFGNMGMVVNKSSTLALGVTVHNRFDKLKRKWQEFSGVKIVVTDRLHGMIFSAITGTECIAMDNCSGKVKSGYQWIKHLPYIHFCEDEQSLIEAIKIWGQATYTERYYERTPLTPYYSNMKEIIKNELDK